MKFLNLFKKKKTKWKPAKLGWFIIHNAAERYSAIRLFDIIIQECPSKFQYDIETNKIVWGNKAAEIFLKRQEDLAAERLKEIQDFIKINIEFFPQEIIDKYFIKEHK